MASSTGITLILHRRSNTGISSSAWPLNPLPNRSRERKWRLSRLSSRPGESSAVAKSLFEAIGYALGQKAAQAKNAFDLVGGTEEDSLRAEIRLGRDLAAALLERVPLVEENEATRFAAQIGRWLSGNVKEKKLPFIIRVTAERGPNALALPGGPVFVSSPLLEVCQGQRDEIAFVLGHEMAHIVRSHTLDRIVKDAALSLLLRQSRSEEHTSELQSPMYL